MKTSLTKLADVLARTQRIIRPGLVYTHLKTNNYYEVVGACFREEDLVILITYRPLTNPDVVFARPMVEFTKKFKPGRQPNGI